MQALFDADILVFRSGFAAERARWYLKIYEGSGVGQEYEFETKRAAEVALDELLPGKMSREEGKDYYLWSERFLEPVENALHNVKSTVEQVLKTLALTEWDLTMYMSGPSNFRYDVAKTRPYKGNRELAKRPTHEQALRDYIKSKWPTVVSEGEEADDAMGIAQCRIGPWESVICTQDKDLDMIPGLKYDWVADVSYSVTPEQADRNFALQLLMGDPTDNVPGLPGIGKKKAMQALEGVEQEDLWNVVMNMYQAYAPEDHNWHDYLREQGKLLWIRREPGQIWEPPPPPPELDQAEFSML